MANHGEKTKGLGLRSLSNRYFAMRHGESEANVLGVAVGDPVRGIGGFGLTETGREQAVESASAFKEAYIRAEIQTEIIASDFRRTRQTAELLAKSLGNSVPVRLTAGLRERFFGELEGKQHEYLATLLERLGMEVLISRYGCEPAESVHARVVKVVQDLEAEKQGKTLILVSHADPIQFLMAAFAGLDVGEPARIIPLNCAETAELSLCMPLRFKDSRLG